MMSDDARSRCAVGVVTYNPDVPRLTENLASSSLQTDWIVVVDNGSENVAEIEGLLRGFGSVSLIKNDKNHGLATALNQVASIAQANNREHVLLLDQDSVPAPDMLEILYRQVCEDTAIVCPLVIDRNEKVVEYDAKLIRAVDRTITSGSLLNLRAWSSVGGYDERLFVDWVDFEFCDNLRLHGYRMVRTFATTLLHELGHKELACKLLRKDGQRGFVWRDYYRTNHTISRLRDKCRSQIITIKKYWNCRDIRNEEIAIFIKGVAVAILVERRRGIHIKAIVSGVHDGLKHRVIGSDTTRARHQS